MKNFYQGIKVCIWVQCLSIAIRLCYLICICVSAPCACLFVPRYMSQFRNYRLEILRLDSVSGHWTLFERTWLLHQQNFEEVLPVKNHVCVVFGLTPDAAKIACLISLLAVFNTIKFSYLFAFNANLIDYGPFQSDSRWSDCQGCRSGHMAEIWSKNPYLVSFSLFLGCYFEWNYIPRSIAHPFRNYW